jgi:hypothetical protein
MMREIHGKATGLLAQIIEVGQERGEIRKELVAADVAQTLRQSLLGAMLIWSLYGDGSLEERIEKVLKILWSGLAAPGDLSTPAFLHQEGKSA